MGARGHVHDDDTDHGLDSHKPLYFAEAARSDNHRGMYLPLNSKKKFQAKFF